MFFLESYRVSIIMIRLVIRVHLKQNGNITRKLKRYGLGLVKLFEDGKGVNCGTKISYTIFYSLILFFILFTN